MLMNENICQFHHFGTLPYQAAWDLQSRLAAEIAIGDRPATLLMLEHPHTYTFGRRGHAENLLWDETECARRGVTVHWVDRGGDVTYHGPGQLVGYPLLPLAPGGLRFFDTQGNPRLPQVDFVGYLRQLETVLINTLAHFGIEGFRVAGMTGVWVRKSPAGQPAKIAAIGVKVDARGVSRHGFALNIAPDMTYWQGIIGCGLKGHAVTSMAELLTEKVQRIDVERDIISVFGEVFQYRMQAVHQESLAIGTI